MCHCHHTWHHKPILLISPTAWLHWHMPLTDPVRVTLLCVRNTHHSPIRSVSNLLPSETHTTPWCNQGDTSGRQKIHSIRRSGDATLLYVRNTYNTLIRSESHLASGTDTTHRSYQGHAFLKKHIQNFDQVRITLDVRQTQRTDPVRVTFL